MARLADSSELEMDYQESGRRGPLTTSTSVRVCVPEIKTLYFTVYIYVCVHCIQSNVCVPLYSAKGIHDVVLNKK